MALHATGLIIATAVLVAASGFGLWRRRTDGTVRALVPNADRLTEAELGAQLGGKATLLQFSSPVCRPCEATRRILSELSGDGVAHVEIDAETRLDLVRRLSVLRTPTVLILGPDGRIAHRASGAPRRADIRAAVHAVVNEGETAPA